MKPTILVTDKEFEKGKDVFLACSEARCEPAPQDEVSLAAQVEEKGARVAIVGVERYVGALYEALSGGLIVRFGVGYDGISKDLCKQYSITLANTPGVLDLSVAEHTIWLMGALARKVVEGDRAIRRSEFSLPGGEELCGKTLLLAGFGRIARLVAHIAGVGLRMKVIAFDILPLTEQAVLSRVSEAGFLEAHSLADYTSDLERVLPEADVISIHMPSNESTHHFFNTRRLDMCRDSALLINTARGPIVDEATLYDALVSGRLAGAALDVFETEPYVPVHPGRDLRTLPNVVLTPHIGSNTRQSNRRMAEASLSNCLAFLASNLDRLTRVPL